MSSEIKKIALIGVGGGGMKTIDALIQDGVVVDKSIAINRNKLFILDSKADDKIKLNASKNGSEVMIKATLKHEDNIKDLLHGIDAVILIAGLGGVTGTYASPEIARIAKDMGLIVWAVVVMPFEFEGKRRIREAESGLEHLNQYTTGIRCVKNQELNIAGRSISMVEAFRPVDTAVMELIKTILDNKGSSNAVISNELALKSSTINNSSDDSGRLYESTLVCEPVVKATEFVEVSLDTKCSFCNQPLSNTKRLIFSSSVFICHSCAHVCAQQFKTAKG